jgi:hypothetical protein
MAKNKTLPTQVSVDEFIKSVEQPQKVNDSYRLIELMKEVSGYDAYMWGSSIIGFGNYHYKYASGHEGEAPILGFSPRKSAISLYVFTGLEEHTHLLEGLGKFTMGKACIYVKKLSDINEDILRKLMHVSIQYIRQKYG